MNTLATNITTLKLDIEPLLNALKHLQAKGATTVDIQDLLIFGLKPIDHFHEKTTLLENFTTIKPHLNKAEFARALKVSRQTIYNWQSSGLIIETDNRIDLAQTLHLWRTLQKLI